MHQARHMLAPVTVLIFMLALVAPKVNAGTIDKLKGAVGIVTLDAADGNPAVGAKFFAMENGKKKALLEIVQVKNGKAKVKVLKGKPAEGMTLAHAGGKAKAQASGEAADPDAAAADEAEAGSSGKKKMRYAGGAAVFQSMTVGILGGYSMDSQTVNLSGATTALSGTGFSAKGFIDVPVTSSLDLYSRIGAEQFNVTGGTAKTEILYAVVDLLLKYNFSNSTFVPFVMGGLGLHFPLSKTSNNLNVNQISSTTVFYGGGGINWLMGGSTYLQFTGEYGMFPPSNDVSTSFISIRTGLGFRF
jgi:hypothetical protein